jgi:AcrR family transcriptional regulator
MRKQMDDFAGGRPLVYKSDLIFERRRRVLRETRKMIAERGVADFSVRELCARSEIAQKTLYNAFGNKENVIALAVREYLAEFNQRSHFRFDSSTLEGVLEMLIKIQSRNIQMRPYTMALMSVYYSTTADGTIRNILRSLGEDIYRDFLNHLSESGQLRPQITTKSIMYACLTQMNAILFDWCIGEIADEHLVDHVSEAVLVNVTTSTTSEISREADRWLQDLREQRPSWKALRKLAEVVPSELWEEPAR